MGPFDPPMCIDNWKPGEIVEVNSYYPFGLMHNYTATTQNAYQYKYNGKELQETGMYDYGARMYMPEIGRWGVMDALSEKYRRHSPYNYAINNPMMFVDPDGNDVTTYTGAAAQQAFTAYVATMSTSSESFGGGGGSTGDLGPSRWQGFKDWIRNLFGGKRGAEITAFAPGATVSRAVQVGELVPMGEAILTWEEVTAALGSLRGGVWGLPLMLNGDSGFAPNSIPFTPTADIPTTTDVNKNSILLYRGIAAPKNVFDSEMYSQGLAGIAIPHGIRTVSTIRGPHRSQDLHAEGDNYSIWTSWTTDPVVARHFSGGAGGIILSKHFQVGYAIPNVSISAQGNSIPSGRPENEWLVPGIVFGAGVQIRR